MNTEDKHSLAIHGGAGSFKTEFPIGKERLYIEALEASLLIGHKILKDGGPALDAVEASVKELEDCPLFNAGKGSVFTHEGKIEMDAAIMDGKSLRAGSVSLVTHIKNPVSAARTVMEKSEHVMLGGEGAESFAKEMGLKIVDTSYFFTQERWDTWQRIKLGTVGAVALDNNGNLAAATSTGGMTNKKYGRIGDSPIIGAGLYAKNGICAVSSTGHGEFFIRLNAAYDIAALMEYKHFSLEAATHEVIKNKLTALGGSGGVIAVDSYGNVSMTFSTETMFRAFITQDGKAHAYIF